MTRRKFIQKLIKAGSAVIVGAWFVAKKALPRRFVCAAPYEKYPGFLRPLKNIFKQSKWSG